MNTSEQADKITQAYASEDSALRIKRVVRTNGSIRLEVAGGKLGKRSFEVELTAGKQPTTSKYAYLLSFNPEKMDAAN